MTEPSKMQEMIEKVMAEDKELLDRLDSDNDENGTPYWCTWR